VAHISENGIPLALENISITELDQLNNLPRQSRHIYLLRLPPGRTDHDALISQQAFQKLATFCANLDPQATVCILTTPPDAARLCHYLEPPLKFQLWVAIKNDQPVVANEANTLPQDHAALLILTRYSTTLIHTKTRIAYTYCPACGKTTKDYGGKKHLHHVDGTLISDVWRDIKVDLYNNIDSVIERLCDLFGLAPYSTLTVLDFCQCSDLTHNEQRANELTDNLPAVPTKRMHSRLIQDDCLKALKHIPDNSIDFCFADLPYNLDKKYAGYEDTLESQEYFAWCNRWLSELARIVKPGHTCAILNVPFGSIHHYQYLATVLDFQAWIAWDSLAFPARQIMPAHYAILCFSKGTARPLPGLHLTTENEARGLSLTSLAELFCIRSQCVHRRQISGISDRCSLTDLWHDIHRLKHNARRVNHPCQLPPALMRRLFGIFTEPGEIILDCVNGTGTSTLVAAQLGRRYIGIEVSKKYHRIALERHAELERGLDPFRKRTDVPKAKNSPVRRVAEQNYEVSKKTLQLEVKRIAELLGRMPSRGDVARMSQYPFEYYETYFVSWGEVCAAARTTGMTEFPPNGHSPQLGPPSLLDTAQSVGVAQPGFASDTHSASLHTSG